MVVHNFRTVNKTYAAGHDWKEGRESPKAENWPDYHNTVINPELSRSRVRLQEELS